MDKNAELLFEYLRNILYGENGAETDLSELDPDFSQLGDGLLLLERYVRELKEFSGAIARGDLESPLPDRENPLCWNLKNIQSNLKHLTWQALQVAKGDYHQSVCYMGEFSLAFNSMIAQLKEREELLCREVETSTDHARLMQNYNELLENLMGRQKDLIVVVQKKTGDVLYCNRREGIDGEPDECENCVHTLSFRDDLIHYQSIAREREWEVSDEKTGFCYQVDSFEIEWQGTAAYVHVIRNVTETRLAEKRLEDLAYRDALTGCHNRRYFDEQMQLFLADKKEFCLCYLDIDGLKYVNDHYGHSEGDAYICTMVNYLIDHVRVSDVIARLGGDEFGILFAETTEEAARQKLENLSSRIKEHRDFQYQPGFSYGVVHVGADEAMDLTELMRRADGRMYQCKQKHKLSNENIRIEPES